MTCCQPDTIELIACGAMNCTERGTGTGHDLTGQGWRSNPLSVGLSFLCPLHADMERRDFIRAAA